MGSQGLAGKAISFADDELAIVRSGCPAKPSPFTAVPTRVQNNIISKNILGLPETTQKG